MNPGDAVAEQLHVPNLYIPPISSAINQQATDNRMFEYMR